MELNFRKIGSGQPLIILHGLFGSSDNWQTLGKKWSEKFQVYLVDLRNHGHSPHSEEMNYKVMASDLKELFQNEGIQNGILMGHSMGGKAAMKFADENQSLLDKLVVVDITPREYPIHHQDILKALTSANLDHMKSRREVDEHLAESISDISVRQFLMKNLYWKEKGKLDWRINVPVLNREIGTICESIEIGTINTPTLFIGGENSDYITSEDRTLIDNHFKDVKIVMLQNVGHWVHAEAPKKFDEILMKFID